MLEHDRKITPTNTGTITFKEAKYSIYKNVLGFEDFKNWDGVRFGFRGVPMAIIKLKEAITAKLLSLSYSHCCYHTVITPDEILGNKP